MAQVGKDGRPEGVAKGRVGTGFGGCRGGSPSRAWILRSRLVLALSACALLGVAAFVVVRMTMADDATLIERASPATTVSSLGETTPMTDGTTNTQAELTGSAGASSDSAVARTDSRPSCVVHVDGAVASPGVYALTLADPRVNDAVAAAGGLVPEADTASVNLAAAVQDGDKVYVPREGDNSAGAGAVSSGGSSGSEGGTAVTGASGSALSSLVNINKASAEELDALPGVGPSTAQAIVDDRTQNGPFASIEDLMRVSGIGEKKFERLKGRICV